VSIKLYYAPGACSFVPHVLLETAGAEYEPVNVRLHKGEQNSPEFRAVNPRGQVPVLVDGGTPINQILAIVTYIDQRFPDAGFLPHERMARTHALETLAWMNNTVHPTFTHYFMPFKFAPEEAQAAVKAFNAENYGKLIGDIEAMAQKAKAEGREWLAGERFGPVDAYALTLLRWSGFAGYNPESFAALWAHVQKVAALPAVARVIEREKLQLNLYKPPAQ
jgi:glutathione S-transferase